MSGWVWGALAVAVPSVAGVVKCWLKLRFLRYLAKLHGPNGAIMGAEAVRRAESSNLGHLTRFRRRIDPPDADSQ
jgi:hypothetical protein